MLASASTVSRVRPDPRSHCVSGPSERSRMSALNQNVSISGSPAMAVQRIIAEWREAERQMALLDPETDEFRRIRCDVERLRTAYREMLDGVLTRR